MKGFSIIICMLFLCSFIKAQDEVEVYQKEEGNKIIIMGKNNLDEAVEVTIKIDYKGYKTSDSYPKIVTLAKREEKAMSTLTAPPNTACEYGISLSYKKKVSGNKKVTRTTGIQINPVKVNVFTRDDCPRCQYVIETFDKNKVVYLELNTTIAPDNLDLMFDKLNENGYKSTQVQMPVVIYKDKIYYNIENLKEFVKQFN